MAEKILYLDNHLLAVDKVSGVSSQKGEIEGASAEE